MERKFTCDNCSKSYSLKDSLTRHQKYCGPEKQRDKICDCGAKFFRTDHLKQHQKRCPQETAAMKQQKPNKEQERSTVGPEQWECVNCNIVVNKSGKLTHCRSASHKDKAQIRSDDGVYKLITCFEDKILIYRLLNQDETNLSMQEVLDSKRHVLKKILRSYVERHTCITFQMEACAKYVKDVSDGKEPRVSEGTFFSNHAYTELTMADIDDDQRFNKIVDKSFNQICGNSEEALIKGSGWTLSRIVHLDVHISKKVPLIGGAAYMELPDHLRKKNACVNPINKDSKCFLWCIKAYFLYEDIREDFQRELVSCKGIKALSLKKAAYKRLRKRLNNISRADETRIDDKYGINCEGVAYPMKLEFINQFLENNPTININVFGISAEDDKSIVGPLFSSRRKAEHNINLLYLSEGDRTHYVWIKDLSRLAARQRRTRRTRQHYCNMCLLAFNTSKQLQKHEEKDCIGIVTVLPEPGETLKFKAHQKQIKAPFVVYADFECKLTPVNDGSSNNKHKHVPSSFSYLVKCSFDESLDRFRCYRGASSGKKFVKNIIQDVKDLYEDNIFNKYVDMHLTDEEEESFQAAVDCHICKKPITSPGDKVRDHCHYTGAYRGSAHNGCNRKYRLTHEVPILFHNFSKYDAHLFIKELCELESVKNVRIIPSNTETYISVIKQVELERSKPSRKKVRTSEPLKEVYLRLAFKDSFRFLGASVDTLAKSLEHDTDFKNLEKFFPTNGNMLKRKGVFPYELVKDDTDFDRTEFPKRADFGSCLNNYQLISEEDYQYAKLVYKTFKCKDLGEYSDLYLKTDVCILADVFEKFREECLDPNLYGLDPVHYYTSPGLSWDALLKVTDCQIELLSDLEMINFIRSGIRGGLSQCSHRQASAHNKYTHPGETIEDPSYLMYYDVNNLYGWAMCQKLPVGEYEWLSSTQTKDFNVELTSENDDYGYILEVDIDYPSDKHVQDSHCDLPFLPERVTDGNC